MNKLLLWLAQHRLTASALLVAGALLILADLLAPESALDPHGAASQTSQAGNARQIESTQIEPAQNEPSSGTVVRGPLSRQAQPQSQTQAQNPNQAQNPPQIVLILDDIGNNLELGQRAVQLPGQLTYAVLPHTPHGRTLANLAQAAGKEVMLHMPMSNLARQDPGPGQLDSLQDPATFSATLLAALESIPHVRGLNNHTGSALTTDRQAMDQVMTLLQQRGLYFVDSLTTASSIAATTATAHGVPNLTRNVFLDNDPTAESIAFQFQRLLQIARAEGHAIGIGHPYPETLAYLETALPDLAATGVELITASNLLRQQAGQLNPAAW
ncbi:MAG: divergent polysaccharide deacetylase family protein [Pseudomonadales bacterium]|nr:divergent polysaccharide deacetylase family protein [Pseudomonadales bacterium]